jgi:hypothetical protein
MTKTTTVTWKTTKGQTIEATIELTRELREETAYADGYNVSLGTKAHEELTITITLDGKKVLTTSCAPTKLTPADKKRLPAIAYAIIGGKVILTEENYNMVMDAINTLTAEIETETTTEYAEVKATEEAKEAAEKATDKAQAKAHAQAIKNGLCPKCGTYCCGDCSY